MSRLSKFGFGVLALALSATAAAAQDPGAAPTGGTEGETRIQFEPYLSQYFGDIDVAQGGFGARLLVAAPSGYALGIFSRPAIGAFGTYTSEDEFSTLHVGGELDLRLFSAPVINGRVDPFISIGAGLFRTKVDTDTDTELGEADLTSNDFAFTPGIGANFVIQPGMSIGARGDIGYQFIFAEENANSPVIQLGLTFGF